MSEDMDEYLRIYLDKVHSMERKQIEYIMYYPEIKEYHLKATEFLWWAIKYKFRKHPVKSSVNILGVALILVLIIWALTIL